MVERIFQVYGINRNSKQISLRLSVSDIVFQLFYKRIYVRWKIIGIRIEFVNLDSKLYMVGQMFLLKFQVEAEVKKVWSLLYRMKCLTKLQLQLQKKNTQKIIKNISAT